MANDGERRPLVLGPLRRLSADLVAVVLLVIIADIAVFAPTINQTPLRVVLGVPFMLFLPGYAFIAALFPEKEDSPTAETDATSSGFLWVSTEDADESRLSPQDGINGIERVALSFGLSIAITPLIVLVLNFTPLGVRLVPIALAISGFTIVMASVAAVRRWRAPAEKRFYVPYRRWCARLRTSTFQPGSRVEGALNVVLVLSLLLAVSSVSYALLAPREDEPFTTLYVVTEDDSGNLTASGYPRNITAGESESLIVGIENHEHQSVRYSLVVELQFLGVENNSTRVLREETLHRFSPMVGSNETWQQRHRIEPMLTGERLRLAYLLYRGDPPNEPTISNAYRETHLRINVTDSDSTNTSARSAPSPVYGDSCSEQRCFPSRTRGDI